MILNYVNQIVQLIQPQKMLFISIDGVAPRAKMAAQRSGSFKRIKQYQEFDEILRESGIVKKEEHFNKYLSLSAGNEFTYELSKRIRFFIQKKIMEDERWRKVFIY